MPALVVAAVAAVAAGAAQAAIGGVLGAVLGAVVGAVVSIGLSYAFGLNKPKRSSTSPLRAEAQDSRVLVRSSAEPHRVIYGRARVSGPIVYAASSGADQSILHLVVVLAAHRVEAIGTVWLNDDPIELADMSGSAVVSGKYAGKVNIERYHGDQITADSGLVAESPDGWGADDKLLGLAYLYLRLQFDRDLFQGGVPNVSALVAGRNEIYDPRSGTTGYTNNWALCVRDYLRSDFGRAVPADAIDDDYFIAAANLSSEAVYLNEAETLAQVRYSMDGSFQLDRSPADIISEMLDAGGGALVYVAGKFRLFGGAYTAPSASLGPSDFAGPLQVQTRPSRRELFNAVRGTFIDPDRYWQASEFAPVTSGAYEAEDGERIWRDIELPWVIDHTRAQRLARQLLLRHREAITVEAQLRYASMPLSVWQTVAVTHPDLGWSAKPFRIVSWRFAPSEGEISVTLREDQVASYAWVYDDAADAPTVPDTTLISPLSIPAPTGLGVTPTTALNGDGAAVPALLVTWTAAPHAFVSSHEVQWRVSPSGEWSSAEVPAGTNRYVIAPVIIGTTYDVRVRGVGGLVRGAFASAVSGTGAADTTAPGNPTGASVVGVVRGWSISWTNPTDADLDRVQVLIDTGGGSYSVIGESRTTRFVHPGSVGSSGTFAVRAVDRSGNLSGLVFAGTASVSRLVTDDLSNLAVTGSQSATARNVTVDGSWAEILSVTGGNASYSSRFALNAVVREAASAFGPNGVVYEARIRRVTGSVILDASTMATDGLAPVSGALLAADARSEGLHSYAVDVRSGSLATRAVDVTMTMVNLLK